MTPTKADSLYVRMKHAFGQERIERSLQNMIAAHGRDILDLLSDEAQEELLHRCIASHKIQRRYAAESRATYKRRVA